MYDPVYGQGIMKALRSGIFAVYAIGDFLRNGELRGLRRYRLMLNREFVAYWEALRGYYAQEALAEPAILAAPHRKRCNVVRQLGNR